MANSSPLRRRPKLTIEPGNVDSPDHSDSKSRRGSRRKTHHEDPPFVVLLLQVGTVVAIIFLALYLGFCYWSPSAPDVSQYVFDDDDDAGEGSFAADIANQFHINNNPDHNMPIGDVSAQAQAVKATFPPLPVWNLTEISNYDAFAIAAAHNDKSTELEAFWVAAAGLRSDFADTYGGENAARALLERGMTAFRSQQDHSLYPNYLESTACRIQRAKQEQRPFRFAFGGYSVTVGRGNYFSQSFPLVMEKMLHTVFHLLGVELQVRNAAIGGCPSFPYGWCMKNFFGVTDVVSWDYSMNEAGGDPLGLEAYLRHVLQLPRRPMLIVKDTHMALERRMLLQEYVQQQVLRDPIVIHTEPAASPFLSRLEEHRPVGFQEWRKFGGPPGAPGQALHHPAVKEHELVAWILTMHFLAALELLAEAQAQRYNLQCSDKNNDMILPRPILSQAQNSTKPWKSILFGEEVGNGQWRMNPIHCRTSFEPIVSGDLSDITVSGNVAEDIDIMLPKSKMFYNRGWVLDLSEGEKKAKRNLDRFGGLGFVDSKKAYYALPTSKTIRFLLPYEPSGDGKNHPKIGDRATDWYKSIVWCEVNEKRGPAACNIETDIQFQVGGANVTESVIMDAAGTRFMGKKICLFMHVPEKARLTNRNTLKMNETVKLILPADQIDEAKEELVGLLVEAKVTNQQIIKREDACSISHIVWEQVPQ